MVKDSPRHFNGIAIIVLISSILLSACAVNPVPEKQESVSMPEEDEIKLGRQWHPEVLKQYKAYNDNALQGYVQRVGEQLAAKSPRDDLVFRFIVIDSNAVG